LSGACQLSGHRAWLVDRAGRARGVNPVLLAVGVHGADEVNAVRGVHPRHHRRQAGVVEPAARLVDLQAASRSLGISVRLRAVVGAVRVEHALPAATIAPHPQQLSISGHDQVRHRYIPVKTGEPGPPGCHAATGNVMRTTPSCGRAAPSTSPAIGTPPRALISPPRRAPPNAFLTVGTQRLSPDLSHRELGEVAHRALRAVGEAGVDDAAHGQRPAAEGRRQQVGAVAGCPRGRGVSTLRLLARTGLT
jgi:hypothetical protein